MPVLGNARHERFAQELAKGCPVLAAGGTVEVYEAIDMSGM